MPNSCLDWTPWICQAALGGAASLCHALSMPVHNTWVSQHLMQQCKLLVRTVQGAEYSAGCRMTELGHGSNVMGIETQAAYDEQSMEFIITTPRDTASKFWIGGAAQHGKVTIAIPDMARLQLAQGKVDAYKRESHGEAPAGEPFCCLDSQAAFWSGAVQQSADEHARRCAPSLRS